MRLNAYLARAGVASRRGADELIKAGRVTVDGRAGALNTFVEGTSVVLVDGREVGKQALRHVILNKPRGAIATARDPGAGRPSSTSSAATPGSSLWDGSTATRPACSS